MQCIIAMMCCCVCMPVFVLAILRYRTLLQFSSLGVCNGYWTFPERLFLEGGVLTAHLAMRPFSVSTAAACYTHTHPFNGPLSGTNRVSRYQKGKTNLDFTESKKQLAAVASAGPYACQHLATERQPRKYPTTQFLKTRCLFCRSTNSAKALKVMRQLVPVT